MSEQDGLVCAYQLDGKGGGRPLDWTDLQGGPSGEGLLWVHLSHGGTKTRQWLTEESGMDEVTLEAFLAEETRPRSLTAQDGLLVIMRGVNLNPGADPEDMVSIRIWMQPGRAITLRRRRLMAVEDLRAAIAAGRGPTDAGDFLIDLTDGLARRMSTVLTDLDDSVDALEDEVLTKESHELRPKLAGLRRQIIGLRRYLAPQRDALSRLCMEKVGWLTDLDRMRLRELADRMTRYVEDLDSARDRGTVTQEELNSRLAEQMNSKMYVLAVVAGIFLPLGLLTGLLGINVGGIPGTESHYAFAIVCLALLGVAGLQLWLFHRRRWL